MRSSDLEEWRLVPRSFGWYEVSNLGRVRSWWGKVPGSGRGAVGRVDEPRLLEASRNQDGYRHFSMCIEGEQIDVRLHSAICEAFNGPAPFAGAVVRHLDGDRLNNRPGNLAWGTVQENADDCVRHGHSSRGVKNANARLTPDAVREIRRRFGAERQSDIAADFGVSDVTVSLIGRRKTWAHVA